MIKYKHIALWLLGFITLTVISGFGKAYEKTLLWQTSRVDFPAFTGQPFITENEVLTLVKKHYPLPDSLPLREINTALLEESLDNHPSIKKAEVYWTLQGELRLDIQQHRPLARINNMGRSYYLLEEGDTMPLSHNYAARVPLLTGAVADSTLQPLSSFWKQIEADSFYHEYFSGLHITTNGEWILYPRPGHHKVFLGPPHNWENKLKKLKLFYMTAVNEKNLDSIKAINLKFKNQVICRKT